MAAVIPDNVVERRLDDTIRIARRNRPGRPCQKPERVIADKGSDPLRGRLARRNIARIAPHRSGRCKPPTQDGRSLRRNRRRWIVQRTDAWLGNNRRLVVRWVRSRRIYNAFFQIACFLISVRRVLKWLAASLNN